MIGYYMDDIFVGLKFMGKMEIIAFAIEWRTKVKKFEDLLYDFKHQTVWNCIANIEANS